MTKEVLVSLVGNQITEDGDDNIELVTVANYYMRNGHHYILYDEVPEDDGEPIHNMLKFDESMFEMTKKGGMATQMLFDPRESHTTYYNTPAGTMNIETITTQYTMVEEDDYIEVYIRYALEINYNYTSENEILLRVSPK